jgi:hypothetical protein
MKTAFAPAVALLVAASMPPTRAAAHPGSGIAVDGQGVVYFTDTGKGIWRIDPGRAPVLISSSAMHWMAIDPAGRFANTAETFGEWFGRLTSAGAKPTLISCSDFPCVVGTDGNLYYAKMHGLTIVRRTPEGKESVLVTPEAFKLDLRRFWGVCGLACGPDGSIYLVALDSLNKTEGTGQHTLYAVAPNGSIRTLARDFVRDLLPPGQRHPEVRPQYTRGLAADPGGNVYVAVTGNRCVMKVSPEGTATTVLRCPKPWTPTGVDVQGGALYVLEYDDETPAEGRNWPPRVRKVARDGTVTTLATIAR